MSISFCTNLSYDCPLLLRKLFKKYTNSLEWKNIQEKFSGIRCHLDKRLTFYFGTYCTASVISFQRTSFYYIRPKDLHVLGLCFCLETKRHNSKNDVHHYLNLTGIPTSFEVLCRCHNYIIRPLTFQFDGKASSKVETFM